MAVTLNILKDYDVSQLFLNLMENLNKITHLMKFLNKSLGMGPLGFFL